MLEHAHTPKLTIAPNTPSPTQPFSSTERALLKVTAPHGIVIAVPRFSGRVFLPKDRGTTPSFRPQIAWDKVPVLLRDVTPPKEGERPDVAADPVRQALAPGGFDIGVGRCTQDRDEDLGRTEFPRAGIR